MPRRSAVVDNPHRRSIDASILAADRPWKDIAREFGLPYDGVKRYARRLVAASQRGDIPNAEAPPMGPVDTFKVAFGMEPTGYQVSLLTDPRSTIFLKSRQCGATQAAAALAIYTARSRKGADAVIVSPSLTQSKEVTTRARLGLYELGEQLVQDSTGLLRLANGSRVISLPGNARAVRGYSPQLVIVDEASWVLDETYAAVRPLLAASRGRLVVQSTPGAKVGWFFDLWKSDLGDAWLRIEVAADAVPFIDAAFLDHERHELAPEVFAAEYQCLFSGSLAGTHLFDPDRLDALFTDAVAT